MSDPYNQYPPQNQYSHSPAPSSGYGAPPYDQQQQGGYNQGYPPQHQQQGYGYNSAPASEFGPPRRQDSYGPPAAGGFQHGHEGGQFGSYDASNPQGHAGYYGGQQYPPQQQNYDPQSQGQMQPYQDHNQQQQYDPNNPNYQGGYQEHNRDPNAPPGSEFNPGDGPEGAEGERGLGGSLVGGAAGYFLGRKKNHGFLGAVGGALLGNYVGNKFSEHNNQGGGGHHGHHGHHNQNQGGYGNSSWGGGRW